MAPPPSDARPEIPRNGFAKIAERPLEKLALDYDIHVDVPVSSAEYKEALILALVLRFLEAVATEAEAMKIMLDSHMKGETPEEQHIGELTDDLVWDFSLAGEATDTVKILKDWAAMKKVRAERRERVKTAVKRVFPKAVEAVAETKKKAVSKAAAAKVERANKAARGRWVAELNTNAALVVTRDAPPDAHVHVDTNNGCFRVKMPWTSIRSFSWARRGERDAARLALSQMWSWHTEHTSEKAPLHIDV